MGLRRIVIMALLALLGATGVGALLSVLLFDQTAYRLTGTCLILTVTAGAWAVVVRGDPEKYTVGQVAVLAGTAVAALCFVGEVWDVGAGGMQLLGTGIAVIAGLLVTGPAMRLRRVPQLKLATHIALAWQAVAVALWICLAWDAVPELLGWPLSFVLIGVSAVLSVNVSMSVEELQVGVPRGTRARRLLGGTVTLVANALWAWDIVASMNAAGIYGPIRVSAMTSGFSTVATVMGMYNLLSMARGPQWARVVHLVAMAASLLLGGLITFGVDDAWMYDGGRWYMALSIVIACSLLTALVLDRVARHQGVRSVEDLTEIRADCPVCRTRQVFPLGSGACKTCGLGVDIRLRQTKCFKCGYALAGSGGSTACPECGCALLAGASAPVSVS